MTQGFVICTLSVCSFHKCVPVTLLLPCFVWCIGDCPTLNCVFPLHLFAGLVDALRCVQWVLWLTCLSVLDCCALDSVGQETPSTERHEHSHPSRGGHGQHLIPGHGCRLRVSFSLSLLLSLSVSFHIDSSLPFVSFCSFSGCISRGKRICSLIFPPPLPFPHLSVTFSSETCSAAIAKKKKKKVV